MNDKSTYRQSSTTSEYKRHYGEKVSRSSSVSSHRKKKLHGRDRLEVRNTPLRGHQVREEDSDSEGNVAEEVIGSGERTGEYVYGSAGKTVQKRRIKKQMISAEQKSAREASKGAFDMSGKIINGIESAVGKIGEGIGKSVADNPFLLVCAVALGILLLAVVAGLSSCTMMMGAAQGTAITTSFTAKNEDIIGADTDYTELEAELARELEKTETENPGYDEYVYEVDTIGHDGYRLAALLTVLHEDYTRGEVQDTLQEVFDKQYDLILTEVEETRTRSEPKTRLEERTRIEEKEGIRVYWDRAQNRYVLEPYIYKEEIVYWEEVVYEEAEEYLYHILRIELKNNTIDAVVRELPLSSEQLQRYELLVALKGNKSYLF